MKYFEPTGPALRLVAVFILACGTQVAWAQEAAGGQLRYNPEIERIPTSRSLFDVLTVQPDFPTERQDPQTDETDPYGSFYDRPITHDLDRLDPYLERNAGPGIQHVPSGLYVYGGWNDPRDRAPDNFAGQRDPFGLHGQPDNRDPAPEFNDAQAQVDPQFEPRDEFSERLTLGLRYDREATDSAPPCP